MRSRPNLPPEETDTVADLLGQLGALGQAKADHDLTMRALLSELILLRRERAEGGDLLHAANLVQDVLELRDWDGSPGPGNFGALCLRAEAAAAFAPWLLKVPRRVLP